MTTWDDPRGEFAGFQTSQTLTLIRFGFVEFDSPELADAATRINVEIDGRTAEFRLATPSPARPERTGGDRPMRERRDPSEGARNSPNSTVWVGNVAWTAEESEIEECFAQYGDVLRVSLPRDRETGRSRGIAYVEFANLQDAEAVVANGLSGDGIELEGRALRLDFAEKPSENSRGSGGARGGRGGMRGGGRGEHPADFRQGGLADPLGRWIRRRRPWWRATLVWRGPRGRRAPLVRWRPGWTRCVAARLRTELTLQAEDEVEDRETADVGARSSAAEQDRTDHASKIVTTALPILPASLPSPCARRRSDSSVF